ncbi:SpoIIE family protein phosphatase [bacterium]|nr:SpoIIE family protein phosphatase [bacterium]
MLSAPIPANEQERLAELRALAILDTPPEARFEVLVRLTQQLFHVPIAYVALIDTERQWFKAHVGLNVIQTDRGISFCGHAILEQQPLIVPDARLDRRFADNPLVTGEPFVRFYAGHPLAGPRGYHVGTLCLVDREPRTLTEQELAVFGQLARMAESQLQLVDVVASQHQLLETQRELLATQERLAAELQEAADYMRSLLPPPLTNGPVQTEWCYQASSQLGGDIFGYHWLDDDHFAMYLLDVVGHGVGSSLLASSVQTALRSQTLAGCDFRDPDAVLSALDTAFPMETHHHKFFTIWYGVYQPSTRELRCAAAGHHPALLLNSFEDGVLPIGPRGLIIGLGSPRRPHAEMHVLPPGSRLYLCSDGVFEIHNARNEILGWNGLGLILKDVRDVSQARTTAVRDRLQTWQQSPEFPDDFSLVEFVFA